MVLSELRQLPAALPSGRSFRVLALTYLAVHLLTTTVFHVPVFNITSGGYFFTTYDIKL